MKKFLFLLFILSCISFESFAQMRYSGYFDGYWSEWKQFGPNDKIKGNYDGFILYEASEGPWEYRFKFTIHNFKVPNKKQRKKDIKAGKHYEFSGTVEYYVTNKYPSVLSIFRASKGAMFAPVKLKDGSLSKKKISKATIKIAPFKDLPKTYNIWFDDVAFAIDLGTIYFPNVKFE